MKFYNYLNEDTRKTPYIKSLNALYKEFGHKSEIQNILKSISITEVNDEVRVYDGKKLKQTFEDTTNAIGYILEYLAQKFNEKSEYDKFYCLDYDRNLVQADDYFITKSSKTDIINNIDKYALFNEDEYLITKNTTWEGYQNHVYYTYKNIKDLNDKLIKTCDFDLIEMLKDKFNIIADNDFFNDFFEDLYDVPWYSNLDWDEFNDELVTYIVEHNLNDRIAVYNGGEENEYFYYSPIVHEIEDVVINDIGENNENIEGFGYIQPLTDNELKKVSEDFDDIYNNFIDDDFLSFIASSFENQDKEDIIDQFSCISNRI